MTWLILSLVLACESTNVTTSTVPFVYKNNESTNLEILGEILYETKDRVGYIELLKAARNLYPDCDYVIDIMIDQKIVTTTETTTFFMRSSQSIDTNITWIMRGTAVKYIR
jgi:hypothetical protein